MAVFSCPSAASIDHYIIKSQIVKVFRILSDRGIPHTSLSIHMVKESKEEKPIQI
jgi:hypothetical protein